MRESTFQVSEVRRVNLNYISLVEPTLFCRYPKDNLKFRWSGKFDLGSETVCNRRFSFSSLTCQCPATSSGIVEPRLKLEHFFFASDEVNDDSFFGGKSIL